MVRSEQDVSLLRSAVREEERCSGSQNDGWCRRCCCWRRERRVSVRPVRGLAVCWRHVLSSGQFRPNRSPHWCRCLFRKFRPVFLVFV